MSRKRLVVVGDREILSKYGFFYHRPSQAWWYVMNTNTRDYTRVELSLRVYDDNDEVRLHATNDHIKLPSVYNPKYNKDNYLELEEELDSFSFDEWTGLGIIYELITDGVVKFVKPTWQSKTKGELKDEKKV